MIFLHFTRSGTEHAHCAPRLAEERGRSDWFTTQTVCNEITSAIIIVGLQTWLIRPTASIIQHKAAVLTYERYSPPQTNSQAPRRQRFKQIYNLILVRRDVSHLDQREALNVMCFWNGDWWCVKSSRCHSSRHGRIRRSLRSSPDCCVFFILAKLD